MGVFKLKVGRPQIKNERGKLINQNPSALQSIFSGIRQSSLATMLGWQDIKQRYRRSKVGPFWLTISMGVMIFTIGIVFGQVFNSPMKEYLPFLAAGIIFWNFISGVINDGCLGFVSAEQLIKQLPIPIFVHILRIVWRNALILLHNLVILPIVMLVFGTPITPYIFLAVPGIVLVLVNLTWMALLLGVVCARFRDMPNIVASILQVVFYLTPVIWMPNLLPGRAGTMLLDLNPFYHLLEIIRLPFLGQLPNGLSWLVALGIAVVGWAITLKVFGRYQHRLAYWL
jgi:lipopolysaccharide transport system permease protein